MSPDDPGEDGSPDDAASDEVGEAPASDGDAGEFGTAPDETSPTDAPAGDASAPDERTSDASDRPQRASQSSSGEYDRTTAAIFALLLGGLGVHKFYLGKIGQGLLYLCFFWTLIPALVAFVEGVIYLSQSDEEFQKKYGA